MSEHTDTIRELINNSNLPESDRAAIQKQVELVESIVDTFLACGRACRKVMSSILQWNKSIRAFSGSTLKAIRG